MFCFGFDPSQEQRDVGELDRRLAGGDNALVVLTQATIVAHPRKSAFDHPTLRHNHKAFRILRMLRHFESPIGVLVFKERSKIQVVVTFQPNMSLYFLCKFTQITHYRQRKMAIMRHLSALLNYPN